MERLIKNVETLEELKKVYKKLALTYHPDCGGDEEIMKALNNEYDELFQKLKNTHKNKEGEFYEKETTETAEESREIIYKLLALKMKDVVIEVIGRFLWVSGNTKPYKDELGKNGLGLKWSRNKSAWYLSPEGYKKFSKKKTSLEDIREMYGSQQVKEFKQKQLTAR